MVRSITGVACWLMLVSWVSDVQATQHTLAEHRVLTKVIGDRLGDELARTILTAPYDGFYQISGRQNRGKLFRFTRIKEKNSYPDDRWNQLALDVVRKLNFRSASNTAGRKTKPTAIAYVVFYRNGIEGVRAGSEGSDLALVMIDQKNVANRNAPTMAGASAKRVFLVPVTLGDGPDTEWTSS